ncbi:hypothetical protein FACS1894104_0810 [Actinomycetota bacterium]|nr:hypothetical protein FACS1894104_0810 [Actinomycetota bacterium]
MINIINTAYKHGISDSDILACFNNFIYKGSLDDGKFLLLGWSSNSTLLEMMFIEHPTGDIDIFHCMKARKQYTDSLRSKL